MKIEFMLEDKYANDEAPLGTVLKRLIPMDPAAELLIQALESATTAVMALIINIAQRNPNDSDAMWVAGEMFGKTALEILEDQEDYIALGTDEDEYGVIA